MWRYARREDQKARISTKKRIEPKKKVTERCATNAPLPRKDRDHATTTTQKPSDKQRLKPLALATTCAFPNFLTFKLAYCPTPAMQTATFWLSHALHRDIQLSYSFVSHLLITLPLVWAIQVWATSWFLKLWATSSLLYLLTDYSTNWLSNSIVSYLLETLPLEWAIQLFVSTEVSNVTPLDQQFPWLF